MASYLHPGVYIEELPSGSRPIEGVGTSTACFIGYVTRGAVGEPTLISSFDDYQRSFGGLREDTGSNRGDDMGHAVSAFFLNGGGKAYIVRAIAGGSATPSSGTVRDVADTADLLEIEAANPGAWANGLVVRFVPRTLGATTRFTVSVGTLDGSSFVAQESFSDLVPEPGAPTDMIAVVNASSTLIRLTLPAGGAAALRNRLETPLPEASPPASPPVPTPPLSVTLGSGSDGNRPLLADYQAILTPLLKVRDISIMLLPGIFWGTVANQAIINAAVAHCETIRNRMLLVDPEPGNELSNETEVNSLDLPTSTYAVTYYPWVRIANPFYNPDANPAAARTLLASPAAMAAGLWAKTDGRRGVWKAPAGIEFPLLGAASLEFVVEDPEQDFLNPAGVNAIRRLPGFGPVVWGTRTRSTRANPEWRYVPVRRTAIFIEESIYNGIQWAVFEPNDHRLWASLRTNIESFMNGLFRVGAFQGEKSSDAYFVRCGLGQTMTQGDIDRGQVIVLVGFAPLKPAEFVIVRIQQKVAQE
ncbi:MAG: phage tail sheath subtilisin-like domain-containing protein [Candidatus Accumulibacter sp.]|uniref:phage tail sheath C-terminal domain-containing protein n=1 Tax=Accumulibacter sp. TaxID=2053492 RepID=UPI001A5AE928|nr:phage tail sheath C-terminal domain-containing protein [Accumulibacter sp.]MBL8394645.1 phage tail sheath subtilisin-like domain-containing protein [Accumulibacter sp.]